MIIGLAGSKRAGKDSSALYITGMAMKKAGIIEQFDMDVNGDLMVNYAMTKEDGTEEKGMGRFDPSLNDPVMEAYLAYTVWPVVKIYHFAEPLKALLEHLYKVPREDLYSANKDSIETHIKWASVLQCIPEHSRPLIKNAETNMTVREALQHIADVFRAIDRNCFINAVMNQVTQEQSELAIIADIRTVEEVEAVRAAGGKTIFLTRYPNKDEHFIENGFKDVDKETFFDAVIDNRFCNLQDRNKMLFNILNEWGSF
jgi:hypothetical protein